MRRGEDAKSVLENVITFLIQSFHVSLLTFHSKNLIAFFEHVEMSIYYSHHNQTSQNHILSGHSYQIFSSFLLFLLQI